MNFIRAHTTRPIHLVMYFLVLGQIAFNKETFITLLTLMFLVHLVWDSMHFSVTPKWKPLSTSTSHLLLQLAHSISSFDTTGDQTFRAIHFYDCWSNISSICLAWQQRLTWFLVIRVQFWHIRKVWIKIWCRATVFPRSLQPPSKKGNKIFSGYFLLIPPIC